VTIVDEHPTSQRAPWAKQRILETATTLFYDEGIRTVGVDRLISKSEVTKATFYKHYRSKDNLVVAYVTERHHRDQECLEELIRQSAGPAEAIKALVAIIVAEVQQPNFRGCLFLNAAAEYPDPAHAVRTLVVTHRDWYTELIAGLLGQLGHPLPGEGADEFLLARDGAMIGSYSGDSIAAAGALQRIVAHILAETNA
jgi:AcrR family transcriptional regulator